jgi:hypothetical protein
MNGNTGRMGVMGELGGMLLGAPSFFIYVFGMMGIFLVS